jgi:hypothetical protein
MEDTKKDILQIIAIETDKGFYVSRFPDGGYSYNRRLDNKLFNRLKATDTFHPDWSFIPTIPFKVSHIERQPNINYRFILKDDTLKSKKLPLEIKSEDAGAKDCEGNFIWKEELAMYRSLYQEISDPQPDKEVEEEFDFKVLFKVPEIKPPTGIKYPDNPLWIDHEFKPAFITNSRIEHQVLDKIIFPTILLHETPCRLSSEDTYNLIRNYIKLNINPKYAKVTSDYNFCFEVAKIVGITKPFEQTYTKHPGYNRRRKPIVETRLVSSREVKVFEMTSEKDKYNGYTPIKGFVANNETELKEQIDAYLKELIDYINEPLIDCPHCQGKGVMLNSNVEPPTHK